MKATHGFGLALAVALVAGCAGPMWNSDHDRNQNTRYGSGYGTMVGTWQIDPSRSDNPGRSSSGYSDRPSYDNGDRDRDRDDTNTLRDQDDNNTDRRDTDDRTRSGYTRPRSGMSRLPDVIRIEGGRDHWNVLDTNGNLVEEIATDQSNEDNDDVATGRWQGGQLVVDRQTRSGGTVTQTFSLQNRGRVLVVNVDVDGPNGTRSYRRVYDRIS